MPLVSIVTATYNSMKYFEETMLSVMQGDFQDFEWIVIDDASNDGTREFLKQLSDPRIKLHLKSSNKGIGDSYELGVKLSTGKYLLILDHDDTIPERSLTERVQALEKNLNANAAFGPVNYMDDQSNIYSYGRFPGLSHDGLISSNKILSVIFSYPTYPLKQGCVVLRKSFVDQNLGIYDIALFLRSVISGPVVFLKNACLNYRTFRTQYSSSRKKRFLTFLELHWGKYALQFLPWYIGPFVAIYRTILEFAKVVWCMVSARRV